MCLEYQFTQPHKTTLHNDILCKPWEVAGVDVFIMNKQNLICIANYDIKFPGEKSGKPVTTVPGASIQEDIFT